MLDVDVTRRVLCKCKKILAKIQKLIGQNGKYLFDFGAICGILDKATQYVVLPCFMFITKFCS